MTVLRSLKIKGPLNITQNGAFRVILAETGKSAVLPKSTCFNGPMAMVPEWLFRRLIPHSYQKEKLYRFWDSKGGWKVSDQVRKIKKGKNKDKYEVFYRGKKRIVSNVVEIMEDRFHDARHR